MRVAGAVAMTTSFEDILEDCTRDGPLELPPIKGRAYAAFVVHPPYAEITAHPPRGEIIHALAVAHREGEKFVVDLVRDDTTIDVCAPLLKSYGVTTVTGAESDGDEAVAVKRAHAGSAPPAAEDCPPFFIRRRGGKSTAFALVVVKGAAQS